MAKTEIEQQYNQPRTSKSGLLTTLLWNIPWKIIGFLFVSLLFSLLIEYLGMAFIWPEEGANHSKQMMLAESEYFSEGFTRSLILSEPVKTFDKYMTITYQWMFQDSGFYIWLDDFNKANYFAKETMSLIHQYLLATVYIVMVFFMRISILILSLPLFIMVIVVGIIDGLMRRDLRRYGAAYESSFVYHHAKNFTKPATYIPCILYLSSPFSVNPNFLLLPAALLLGLVISVTTGSFKKYL